jgi:16S rRNA (cytidine1402-2'-O)-methyltransferase
MPSLYIVATPIGNLEDITLRALRVLGEVDLIAAEDTRITRRLLDRHGISTPLTSYHEHNRLTKLPALLDALVYKDVALVSDAGTPGINDPGHELVHAAAKGGVRVIPIPGPSALTTALAASGLPVGQFVYLGFLPRRRAERRRLLESLDIETRTLVAFEAPHRLKATLEDALATLRDRRIAVCRELTKVHEEVFRGTLSEAIDRFTKPRGEFTLVIEGAAEVRNRHDPNEARELIARLRMEGLGAKDSVARVAEKTGISRRDAYRIWLESGAGPSSHDGPK